MSDTAVLTGGPYDGREVELAHPVLYIKTLGDDQQYLATLTEDSQGRQIFAWDGAA